VQRLKIIAALTVTPAYRHGAGADRESLPSLWFFFIFLAFIAFVPPV
jgi:hypothetical protein